MATRINEPQTKKTVALKDRRKRIIRLFQFLLFDIAREKLQGRVLGKRYVEQRSEERNRLRAERFTESALELGGVLIKLGQYMSTRFDLLPPVWIKELTRLQDAVPSVAFEELRPVIEQDLGGRLDELFSRIETRPLASASLGQVHEAWLPDGTHVAVKVRRPGIDVIVEADLEALNRVIDLVGNRTDLGKLADLKGIAREFEVTLRRELDYVQEARNAERFRENLKKLKHVYVPIVYPKWCSGRVLTAEFIDGFKITNYAEIDAAGVDRHRAARILANCYLNQFLIDGFFHADPHPGNLFVRERENGVQVVFIDFGMVGEMPREMRLELRRMTYAMLNRDIEGVVSSFRALKFVRREEDVDKIRVALTYFMDKFLGHSVGEIRAMDQRKLLEEVSYIIYSQPLFVPSDFSFLSRAVDTLIGICAGLSPDLNFTVESRPFMQRLAEEELGSSQLFESLNGLGQFISELPGGETVQAFLNSPAGDQLKSNALQLASLPRNLNQTLEKLETGRLQVQFHSNELQQSNERLQKSNDRLLAGILASGALVSGVILATRSRFTRRKN